jgi:hypothetical protein
LIYNQFLSIRGFFDEQKSYFFPQNLSSQEGFITNRGKKVWYQIVGAESQGIPLLALHGGPGCPHMII